MPKKVSKKKEYHVYVVGLKPSVLKEPKCQKQNPNFKPALNKRYYYVGYTGETPETRYNKHITGHKTKKGYDTSSDIVKNHGYKKMVYAQSNTKSIIHSMT